jgi:hypothetical protein
MKRILVLLAIALFFVMTACGKKEIKPTSLESLTAQEAVEAINQVRTGYVIKTNPS